MDVSQAPCFVISFDESLNPDLHEEQMDFIVRFIKDGKVEMRYLGSAFLGYTTALLSDCLFMLISYLRSFLSY